MYLKRILSLGDGGDSKGQAGAPSGTGFIDVQRHRFSCSLDSAGVIECWGDDAYSKVSTVPTGTYTQLSVGFDHACALNTNGSIECWGATYYGVGTPPAGEFTSLVVGQFHGCAQSFDGDRQCWGRNEYGQISNMPNDSINSLSFGKVFSCGILEDTSIGCWGIDNGDASNGPYPNHVWLHDYGQVTDAPSGTGFVQLDAGLIHACALDEAGAIHCWDRRWWSTLHVGHPLDDGQVTNAPTGTYAQLTLVEDCCDKY